MYLGRFYFQKRDFFIILSVALLMAIIFFSIRLPLFNPSKLLVLAILFLLVKASVLPARDIPVFLTFFSAVILTLFFPLFQVILFLAAAFVFLKILKVY